MWSRLRWRKLSGRTGEVGSDWLEGAERRDTLGTWQWTAPTALGGRFACPAPLAPPLPPTFSLSLFRTPYRRAFSPHRHKKSAPPPTTTPLSARAARKLNLDKAIECLDKAIPDPNPSGSEREADPINQIHCHLTDGARPLSLQRC